MGVSQMEQEGRQEVADGPPLVQQLGAADKQLPHP